MVLNKDGNPLVAVHERRDELVRCTAIIGWSWAKVAERLDLTLPGALTIKNCKKGIADSDLRWLQELANAIEHLPRPKIQNDDDNPELARLSVPVQMAGYMPESEAQKAAENAVVITLEAERDRTAKVLANVYMAAADLEGATMEQQSAARWAIAESAAALGLLPQVQALIRAAPPKPVPPVEAMLPPHIVRGAQSWTPPSDVREREPFPAVE
jgi:hypothetical protein